MNRFCENPLCENPAAKMVPVSVDRPSDRQRTLCAVCEEAYSWGVQQGTMACQRPARPHLDSFLKEGGFVILTWTTTDPSRHGPVEAWAYRGPLDFQAARPVTFGVGWDIHEAIEALDGLLANGRPGAKPAATENEGR